ncbi:hypothetical protein PIIN_01493 [Serendipita indica DSM 11827]|uniref:Cyclin-like domain-containing protein n=1 Tax=Serendipita indica (strain DSM 11827) TaxID=1109443 RepID=G4T8M9_SERID|nr:hypothetical protein PIIN_01493 [Serendipita indica DSM 11827]
MESTKSQPQESGGNVTPTSPQSSLSASAPLISSKTRKYSSYFEPGEIAAMSAKQRAGISEDSQEKMRQLACTFIETIGQRMGFPRRTIATGQTIYHRFRLYFPMKEFSYIDVAQAALYVSSKLHDTLKKPQDILEVGYMIQYPKLVNKATGMLDIDINRRAEDRKKLLAIERLILETICFKFTIQMAFPYVIKFSKALDVSKDLAKLAWRLCADSHRTVVTLEYPPHSVALACIYLAGLLATFEAPQLASAEESTKARALVNLLSEPGDWEDKYLVKVDDLHGICQSILDLLRSACETGMHSYSASPATPSSPSPYPSPRTPNPFRGSSGSMGTEESMIFTSSHVIRLKIALREQADTLKAKGYQFRKRNTSRAVARTPTAATPTAPKDPNIPSASKDPDPSVGKNEGTVRFLFGLND